MKRMIEKGISGIYWCPFHYEYKKLNEIIIKPRQKAPKYIIIGGGMRGGKTKLMNEEIEKAKKQGKSVKILKGEWMD